jgi:hypothetical protein
MEATHLTLFDMNMMGAMMAASRRRFVPEPEALALFSAMAVEPNQSRKVLINKTIKDLKDAGIWDKLDHMCIYAAHDEVSSLRDWKSLTRVSTRVSSPTFTLDVGFAGDGLTQRLDMGFNPTSHGVNYKNNDALVFCYLRRCTDFRRFLGGRQIITDPNYLTLAWTGSRFTTQVHTYGDTLNSSVVGESNNKGFIVGARTGNTQEIYRNGVLIGTNTPTQLGFPNRNLPVLAYHNNSGIIYCNSEVSAIGFSAYLTAEENLTLYNIIQNYMTEVGAAV